MLEKLKEIIADQLNVDADSMEEEYGVEIPSEDLEKILTVQDVIDYMKNKGVEA